MLLQVLRSYVITLPHVYVYMIHTCMYIYIYIKDEKGERRFEVCLQRFAELVVCEDLRPTGGGITCDSINEAGWRCCAD